MIFKKIREILAEQFTVDPETITYETSFIDDLNADSLDLLELSMALEEEFDVSMPEDAESRLLTVEDVVNFISESV